MDIWPTSFLSPLGFEGEDGFDTELVDDWVIMAWEVYPSLDLLPYILLPFPTIVFLFPVMWLTLPLTLLSMPSI